MNKKLVNGVAYYYSRPVVWPSFLLFLPPSSYYPPPAPKTPVKRREQPYLVLFPFPFSFPLFLFFHTSYQTQLPTYNRPISVSLFSFTNHDTRITSYLSSSHPPPPRSSLLCNHKRTYISNPNTQLYIPTYSPTAHSFPKAIPNTTFEMEPQTKITVPAPVAGESLLAPTPAHTSISISIPITNSQTAAAHPGWNGCTVM